MPKALTMRFAPTASATGTMAVTWATGIPAKISGLAQAMLIAEKRVMLSALLGEQLNQFRVILC